MVYLFDLAVGMNELAVGVGHHADLGRGDAVLDETLDHERTVAQGDHQVFPLLWQWARRRHPRTARHGIRDTYFRAEDGNNWVFFGHVTRPNGTQQDVRLFRASSVPIRRHTKIKGEANPYDPQWEPSFEARLGVRMAHNLRGRRHLIRLWKEQDGLCAVCQQRITQ